MPSNLSEKCGTKATFYKKATQLKLNFVVNSFQCCNIFSKLPKKFNAFLICWFERLGCLIARRWSYFVIIPLLLGGIALTGLQTVQIDNDFERLALPSTGQWNVERKWVERLFKVKTDHFFDPPRMTTFGHYVSLIIKAKTDDGNILENDIWSSIVDLDEVIMGKTIQYEDKTLNFFNICSLWKGACFSPLFPIHPTDLSRLGRLMSEIRDSPILTEFPLLKYSHLVNFTVQLILGNPQFADTGILKSADAISLFYWLRSDTEEDGERARMWEKRIEEVVRENNSSKIKVSFFASRTPSDEMEIANDKMKPLLGLSGCLMVAFAAICASMRDAVRSKMVLSFIGIFSVVLATGSAFGILMYLNVPFIGINYAAVFLMLGVGIDDMFVFLAVWRMTPIQDSVEMRMRTTYGHAGISITITSLTNVIAFSIGNFTSIRTIQIFSAYSCFSALLTYIFFITFFGGAMAAFGYLEKSQTHPIFCVKVKAKSVSGMESIFYRFFMAGGVTRSDINNPVDNEPHSGMICVRNVMETFLNNSFCKVGICISYVMYIAVVSYGISTLKQEFHPDRISFQQLTSDYFVAYDQYFSRKPSFVQIVFTKELDYSDPETKNKLLDLHDSLESLPFINENLTVSWMKDFYEDIANNPYLKDTFDSETTFIHQLRKNKDTTKTAFLDCYEMLNEFKNFTMETIFSGVGIRKIYKMIQNFPCNGQNFLLNFFPEKYLRKNSELVKILNIVFWLNHYVNKANAIYEIDINFGPKSEKIESSRILMVIENASDFQVQERLRETVKESGIPGVQVFNYLASVIEQAELVKWTTIIATLTTTLVVLLISFIFIPNVVCSLWVAFSIVSIEFGVVGLMALWDVKLNSVSMVNLIMCVGFSVDFSAHISYAYLSANGFGPKEWTREALYSVGLPIILGGLSTIVGVIPLCFSNSTIFLVFFKIILLVILLGMLHGLVYLPSFMSIIGTKSSGRYDLQGRVSFVDSMKTYDRNCDISGSTMTLSTLSGRYSEVCDTCAVQGYLDWMSKDTVSYIKIKPIANSINERNICEICKICLRGSNLTMNNETKVKRESSEGNYKTSLMPDLGPPFDVNSIITSTTSTTDIDSTKTADTSHTLVTLDAKLLDIQ